MPAADSCHFQLPLREASCQPAAAALFRCHADCFERQPPAIFAAIRFLSVFSFYQLRFSIVSMIRYAYLRRHGIADFAAFRHC